MSSIEVRTKLINYLKNSRGGIIMKKLIRIHGNCEYYKINNNLSENDIYKNYCTSEGLSPIDG